jgi:hypothetical protein
MSILALGVLVAACQNTASAPKSSPSHSSHNTALTAVLQPSEIPQSLSKCPGSGPIVGYIASLQKSDVTLATRMSDQWQQLRAKGAVDAAISLFAYDPSACTAELAANSNTKSVASFVAVFADEGQAERAWGSGILGFVTPAPDQLAPGLLRGTGTGLGSSSWTYTSTEVRLVCWRRSVFLSLVVLTNLDSAAFKAVTVAIDARLN